MAVINDLLNLKHTLRFNSNGEFKVMYLSDLHTKPAKKRMAIVQENIRALVDNENPDLIILNGDTAQMCETTDQVKDLLSHIVGYFEEKKIPWAHAFGRTMIFHEAPHKLKTTLDDLAKAFGEDRPIALCRELTKKNEEILRLSLGEAIAHYPENEPRGEYVLILGGTREADTDTDWESVSVVAHVERYIADGMSKMDAIKAVARERGVAKNVIYKEVL